MGRPGGPSGTVTFLFTDVEGSTRLWDAAPEAMRVALERHDAIIRKALEGHAGYLFATGGDGFAVAFSEAGSAIDAAVAAQLALAAEPWPVEAPLRVRMGLHSGVSAERDGDYFGPTVNRAARLMGTAHGGQVVCSSATAELAGDARALKDLGEHRLRDLSDPERLFQVLHDDLPENFPPQPEQRRVAPTSFVRLLGAVEFVSDLGATVAVPSSSQRRLLAVLALASGTTLRPEYLSDLLDVSSGALRSTVSRLRSRLGDDVIRTDAVGYRITAAVDTTMFTDLLLKSAELPDQLAALDEALELWRGEAIDEFRHEPWAEAEAARLDELRSLAIEDRAELLIARSRAGEAVAALEAHITLNPLRDRPRGLLIQALAGDGRQADALRSYQDYRAFLAEETGTEPSTTVRSIERRVAADDQVDAPVPVGSQVAFDVPVPGVLAHGPALIGRRREQTWLESELVEARAGRLRAVLLSGEAGIGKTTLVAAFAREQAGAGGSNILYGRCDDGGAVPLQPFRGIVTSLVDHAPTEVLRAHTERFGGELLRVTPHLASRISVPPPTTGDDAVERYQLFEAVADLMKRLAATAPLILILDDLHWAEPTALLLLRHLTRALVASPVLIVASARDPGEEQSAELRAALADLDRAGARRVALAGFDDAELSDLVVALVRAASEPGSDVLEQLRDQTAGNPLYASQLVRHLDESGRIVVDGDTVRLSGEFADTDVPPSLLEVVWSRVRSLGEPTHEALRAASVLGSEIDEQVLAQIADASEADVAIAMDACVDAGLLVEGAGASRTLHFTHALVMHALYADLTAPRRRRLHEAAARTLKTSNDELSQNVVVQLARHSALGGDLEAAQHWATAAGDYAAAHLAPSEAAGWYEIALEHASTRERPELERADVMVRLGEAWQRAGDPRAHDILLEAANMARRTGADDVLVRAALASDRGTGRIGAVDDQLIALVEAAIAVADPADSTTYARLLALYARELIHTPNFERRQEVARQTVELIEASDDPTLLPQVMATLTFPLMGPGTLPLRRDLAERAVAAALLTDDPFLVFWTSRAAYFVAIESADVAWSQDSLELLTSTAAEVGEPRLLWFAAVYEAFEAMMEARLDDAERHSERMLEIGTSVGDTEDAFSLYAGQLFAIRSFAGRYDEILPLIEATMEANPGFIAFRLAFGISCANTDRLEDARKILDEGIESDFSRIPVDYTWMTTVIGYAVLANELDDERAAAQLYPLLEPFADEVAFSGATSQGPIAAYLGKLASLMGLHDVADEHLRRALDITVSLGWKYHEATTLVALARSQLRRTGALDDAAHAWLDEARAISADRNLPIVARLVESVRT